MSRIIEGVTTSAPAMYKGDATKLCRLWMHEMKRVFSDRLVHIDDIAEIDKILDDSFKGFENIEKEAVFEDPLICTSFMTYAAGAEKTYIPVANKEVLSKTLNDKLEEYNENFPVMNLVLFLQAMEHITRITRVIDRPSGSALLIGVGGSGKQSLSKLSNFLLDIESQQILVSKS